jgi:hypothetical protein
LSASSTHSPALLTTVGCLALVFAAVAVAAICWNWSRQYKLLGLPIAPGTMTRCEPLLTTTSAAANIGTPAVSPVWTVITRYSYSVNGVAHEGVNISNLAPRKIVGGAHPGAVTPACIAAICNKYRPGTEVSVHYQPNDPARSFIYFTSPVRDWPWLLVPLIAGLVGWFFLAGAQHVK